MNRTQIGIFAGVSTMVLSAVLLLIIGDDATSVGRGLLAGALAAGLIATLGADDWRLLLVATIILGLAILPLMIGGVGLLYVPSFLLFLLRAREVGQQSRT